MIHLFQFLFEPSPDLPYLAALVLGLAAWLDRRLRRVETGLSRLEGKIGRKGGE